MNGGAGEGGGGGGERNKTPTSKGPGARRPNTWITHQTFEENGKIEMGKTPPLYKE